MDCGAPRFVGPGAKKLYEIIIASREKAKSNAEKRKKRLEEFSKNLEKASEKTIEEK